MGKWGAPNSAVKVAAGFQNMAARRGLAGPNISFGTLRAAVRRPALAGSQVAARGRLAGQDISIGTVWAAARRPAPGFGWGPVAARGRVAGPNISLGTLRSRRPAPGFGRVLGGG